MSYEKFYPGGWQSGESGGTPITPEALNHIENGIKQTYSAFAPAGYGLGGQGKVCTDCNTALESGFYSLSGGSLQNGPSADNYLYWGSMIVANRTGNVITQIVNYQNRLALRTCEDGVWDEWEYLNPRMIPGVEYRTTERRDGRAVYTKCVSFGYMPGNGEASVEHGLTTTAVWVDKVLADYSSGQVEVTIGAFGVKSIQITRTVMFLLADGNFSTVPVYFYLKYTKD